MAPHAVIIRHVSHVRHVNADAAVITSLPMAASTVPCVVDSGVRVKRQAVAHILTPTAHTLSHVIHSLRGLRQR